MIRWVFFFEEGSVTTDCEDEQRDTAIWDFIEESPKEILRIASGESEVFVNLDRVKCITRTPMADQAKEGANSTT